MLQDKNYWAVWDFDWSGIGVDFGISFSNLVCGAQQDWFVLIHFLWENLITDDVLVWKSWFDNAPVNNDPIPNDQDRWFNNTLTLVPYGEETDQFATQKSAYEKKLRFL